MPRAPFWGSHRRANEAIDLLRADLVGPFPTCMLEGRRYISTVLDDHSGYSIVKSYAKKSEVAPSLIQITTEVAPSLIQIKNSFGNTVG